VMEIASNDGYLLQHFKARGVPCRGIEPAANVAKVAVEERGIPTTVAFFGRETALRVAAEHGRPNLLLGNNVLAHVPDINDFVAGMQALLAPGGQITMEFPHLVRLMDENQFDTIYHEHFSYLSFGTVQRIFAHHGLKLFDVEQLPTHGGSLRIYACHSDDARLVEPSVARLLADERAFGLLDLSSF
jgi:Methyltransferase domain/C-methyltransferase C-terminal domain